MSVGNVTNKLLLLSNIQFVENRVYEDDADIIDIVDNKPDQGQGHQLTKEEQELKFRNEVAIALTAGAKFIQSAFEKVDFDDSDTEDEDGTQQELEPVYEIKSIYHSRRLPHVIGTQAFLVCCSSISQWAK